LLIFYQGATGLIKEHYQQSKNQSKIQRIVRLIETITTSEELKDLMGVLGTRDAHELYEPYGFERNQDRFMRRAPNCIKKINE
jgi:hypothetical protein